MNLVKGFVATWFLSCCIVQSIQAAPIYYTSVGADGLNALTFVEGTTYAYSSLSPAPAGISASWGEASISGNTISVSGQPAVTDDSGLLAQYYPVSIGAITYTDLVFSNTNSNGSGGMANVSANFSIVADSASDLAAQIFINGSYSGYRPIGTGSYSSNTVSVPLDVPVSLKLVLTLKQTGFSDGNGNRIPTQGSASMTLLSIPFQLESGVTVNSLDASIMDNQIPQVPLPSSFWLFGSGLMGLARMRRRSLRTKCIA